MAKTKSKTAKTADSPDTKAQGDQRPADGIRETIEAIVVAFVLAFLFRTFVAEAFVIPTGSMATTLMGRHRDLNCPLCGYLYQVGDSEDNANAAVCPLCRLGVKPLDTPQAREVFPAYNGDRIIVTKFSYAFNDPQRWDVGVFRYPREAATNYIKRLVGMPNEYLMIRDGDIYTRPDNSTPDDYKIERKPPDKVLALLRIVYDNNYVVPAMTESGWPPRWQECPYDLDELLARDWTSEVPDPQHPARVWPLMMPAQGGGWTTEDGYRTFSTDGTADGAWLRYRHFIPWDWPEYPNVRELRGIDVSQLDNLSELPLPVFSSPGVPQPIDSWLYYNDRNNAVNWVSDLALECSVDIRQAGQGELTLELVKRERRFQVRIDLSKGTANLGIATGPGPLASTLATVEGLPTSGSFDVRFANVDHKLYLWINDKYVGGAEYNQLDGNPEAISVIRLRDVPPADLTPAGIASKNAAVHVSNLRLLRDVYYTRLSSDKPEYHIGVDQYFAMGDNTDASSDSRDWNTLHRDLLIGKALLIYWPHSWKFFRPNFERMGFIR